MTNKWMTSGARRLKANLNRSFGARKQKKAAANCAKDGFAVVASARIGDPRGRKRKAGGATGGFDESNRDSSERPRSAQGTPFDDASDWKSRDAARREPRAARGRLEEALGRAEYDREWDAAGGGARPADATHEGAVNPTGQTANRGRMLRRAIDVDGIGVRRPAASEGPGGAKNSQQSSASLDNVQHSVASLKNGRYFMLSNNQKSAVRDVGAASMYSTEGGHLGRLLRPPHMVPSEGQLGQASLRNGSEQNEGGLLRFQAARGGRSPETIDQALRSVTSAGHLPSPIQLEQHRQQLVAPQDFGYQNRPRQPLRYFNNGAEVDIDGNPLQRNNTPGNSNNDLNLTKLESNTLVGKRLPPGRAQILPRVSSALAIATTRQTMDRPRMDPNQFQLATLNDKIKSAPKEAFENTRPVKSNAPENRSGCSVAEKEETKHEIPSSPREHMSVVATSKSKRKTGKKVKSKRTKKKRKKKSKREGSMASKGPIEQASDDVASDTKLMREGTSSSKLQERVDSTTFPGVHSSLNPVSHERINSARSSSETSEKPEGSGPKKIQRVAAQTAVTSVASIDPIGDADRNNKGEARKARKARKPGPHEDLLEQLFGDE